MHHVLCVSVDVQAGVCALVEVGGTLGVIGGTLSAIRGSLDVIRGTLSVIGGTSVLSEEP